MGKADDECSADAFSTVHKGGLSLHSKGSRYLYPNHLIFRQSVSGQLNLPDSYASVLKLCYPTST
jgi:hypothetical protein